ncbi:GNAT family N-acetyltransferase [Chitinolyticbacter meiyuanensis]|uniref:GNAT family N-acetyltransferase n=1 Tax=Chitinolyticbacter meiyuanensis TaxID=682798 RepID=UPI001C9E3214
MFLAREWRGSRHGVGAQLLEALLAWSRDHGVTGLYLGTIVRLLAAHRLCEKHAVLA